MSLRQGAAAAANIELHGRGGATKPSQGVGGHAATPRHVGRTLATSLEKREESGHPWVGVPLLPPPPPQASPCRPQGTAGGTHVLPAATGQRIKAALQVL